MIITFCGHKDTALSKIEISNLTNILLENIISYPNCKFYLGGYGSFDNISFNLLKKFKINFPNIKIIFVTPYINENYYKLIYAKENYDEIIYPVLENTPKRFAILE